jgi:Electron transfer DM13/Bacterial Ig-like domain (group 2)
MQKISLFLIILLIGLGCSKKSEDVAPVEIPERLEMNVKNKSIAINDTAKFLVNFYDKLGNKINPPSNIVWSSSKTDVATISQTGIATGKGSGQTTIKATYNNIEASALLTVVADNNQVATVTLEAIKEVKLNENAAVQAVVKNNLGQVLTGKTITWESDNTNLVSISATGEITGLGYGTANIKATVEGIQSNISMVQVIRIGNFANGGVGTAKLKIENGVLKLQTSSNFSVSGGAPDLRIYLSNSNNATGALEIATLNQRSGMQTWNLPSNVSITQYRYALVWCKQFGGVYGLADLGN